MTSVQSLIESGKELGFIGNDLNKFVIKQQEIQKELQDNERDKRLLEREKIKHEEEQKDLEKEKLNIEKEKLRQAEEDRQLKERLELRKLELEEKKIDAKAEEHDAYTKSKVKIAEWNESRDDFDSFLTRFERIAEFKKWPKRDYAMHLGSLLTGTALEILYGMPKEQQDDYDAVKKELLRKFHYTEEIFRRKFFSTKEEHIEDSPVQDLAKLERLFFKWIDLTETERTFEGLANLIIKEQFLRRMHIDLSAHLREKEISDRKKLAEIAQVYITAHGGTMSQSHTNKGHKQKTDKNHKSQMSSKPKQSQNNGQTKICQHCKKDTHLSDNCWYKPGGLKSGDKKATEKRCFKCSSTSHFAADCTKKHDKGNAIVHECPCLQQHNVSAFISEVMGDVSFENSPKYVDIESGRKDIHTECCENEIHACSCVQLDTSKGRVNGNHVTVMRDSGSSSAIVRESLVKDNQYTGASRICHLIDGTVRKFPLAFIKVDCKYVKGTIEALVMKTPVLDLIIGNTLKIKEDSGDCYQELKLSFKSEPSTSSANEITNNEDAKMDNKIQNDDTETSAAVTTRSQVKLGKKPMTPLKTVSTDATEPLKFLENQKKDDSLKKLFKLAETNEKRETKTGTVHYEIKQDFLHRYFTSKDGKVTKQLVTPKEERVKIMSVAHDAPMSGHMGIKRTLDRVLSNFYWPKVNEDVTRYCRSCGICQKTIKKGSVIKAPLGKMPKIDVPFKRVAMDLIGPLSPMSERKHKYILTVVDVASRYPEACPLKDIDTVAIAEALFEIYSRMGVPQEVLSDQGGQFNSDLMKEISRLLSIHAINSSPYHPICNGQVEKFNGTLKKILKRLCAEQPKQWDRYLPAVLFAYRSAINESTGFSPFELIYGRPVRGPMEILRSYYSSEDTTDDVKTVYKYIIDLKTTMGDTMKIAQEELAKAQGKQKKYYDRGAKPRKIKVGSKVLLLLPTKANKLLLQWKGPFQVIERMSDLNYKIDVKGKIKTFHVNMMKEFHERDDVSASITVADIHDDDVRTDLHLCQLERTEDWRDVVISESLSEQQRQDEMELLKEFDDILTDLPGTASAVKHSIKTTTEEPIHVKAYPIPYAIREIIKAEIEKMLNMGIIRKSSSPYAAPPVLVSKPDGSKRFCVAYMKLNSITVFDSEPMPDPNEVYLRMKGKKYHSTFDLSKGFWQIEMDAESIPKTAFSTPQGHYEFLKMPFGLKNSVSTFNKLMRHVLKDVNDDIGCFVDDVISGSNTWENHLQSIRDFFQRLRENNLHARPSKCKIGFQTIDWVGHEIDENHIKPRQEKVKEIIDIPRPVTKKQVRSFLGSVGYFSKFISMFYDRAKPLFDLTKKGSPNIVKWTEKQEKAFQELKNELAQEPILKIPDLAKDMYLQTDASNSGLGAVLLQNYDGTFHPVKFLSRKLKSAEQNYSTIQKECLAIVWAIQKLYVYLYNREFIILTDHHPLVALSSSGVKNGRIMRWNMFLQDWAFRIEAIRGEDNFLADYLSRQ